MVVTDLVSLTGLASALAQGTPEGGGMGHHRGGSPGGGRRRRIAWQTGQQLNPQGPHHKHADEGEGDAEGGAGATGGLQRSGHGGAAEEQTPVSKLDEGIQKPAPAGGAGLQAPTRADPGASTTLLGRSSRLTRPCRHPSRSPQQAANRIGAPRSQGRLSPARGPSGCSGWYRTEAAWPRCQSSACLPCRLILLFRSGLCSVGHTLDDHW